MQLTLRRAAVASLAPLLLTLLPAATAPAAAAPPPAQYLLAADEPAARVSVFDAAGTLTGSLPGVALDAHAGTLQLDDGRVLLADSASASLLAVRVDAGGTPRVVARTAVPGAVAGDRVVAWMAVDADQRYLVSSSDHEGSAVQDITVVDLADFTTHQFPVTTTPDARGTFAETQPLLAGNPLQVVVTTGGRFTSFALGDVLAGRVPRPTGEAPLGAANHGSVVTADGSAVFSTAVGGLDGAPVAEGTLGAAVHVDYSATVPLTRVVRPRLDLDGHTVLGSIVEAGDSSSPERTHNHLSVVDTATRTARLLPLGDGGAGRVAVSHDVAAVTLTHPAGDTLRLFDLDPRSGHRLDQVGIVRLPTARTHACALTPDGDTAYVANAGRGTVSVVDTGARRVRATWRTPTALADGGYLTVLRAGTPLIDLVGR